MNVSIPFLRGKTIPLSLPRRFVCDLLSFAKQVPSIAMQKKLQLGELVEARARRSSRISWCAIFLKAYATVAAARPELRRAYLSFPWGRLYEHPENVASFSLEREYEGENAVFFARVPRPEEMSLVALDKLVRRHKQAKVESVTSYRQALLLSRLPLPLRRFIWWLGLCTDGMYRAHFFGTFAISVVASLGAASLKILSPLTTTLNYGTFEPDGSIDVRLTYDHRVMDGATVARAMGHLDKVLRTQILEELQALAEAELEAPSESADGIADVEQALAS